MNLNNILESKNIAEQLDDDALSRIASKVNERYNDDVQSRKDKQTQLEEIVKLALSVVDEKSFPWAGASNINYPLISTAAMEFAAKCSPEVLRDDFIVKSKIIGKDDGKPAFDVEGQPLINEETGEQELKEVSAKQERGDRVATYMNYQLNEEIEDWVDNTDKSFISLAVVGTMFKKTYQGANGIESELVYPDKLIMHDKVTKFNKAPCTHIIELYENDIQEKIRRGIFKKFEYDEDASDSTTQTNSVDLSNAQDQTSAENTNSGLHVFLEQCCWLDLDEDDFLEPYVVTLHVRSNQVIRIMPRFSKEDIEKSGNKIVAIKANNPYTPYHFIPSPDGSFYGIGLGHLLLNINKGLNTSINQLTDAGTLQNTGGGFIAKSLKIRGGAFKMKPNEYKMVDAMGGAIRDSIVPLPTPEPSQTLFALLGFLAQAGKELGSLRDVLNGENAANVQATTMMALVEQGITQFKSIFKRIYRGLKAEFKSIYDLNSKYLSNQKYAEILDEPLKSVSVNSDFSRKGFDIVPVADVASVTNTQRMAKASFLMQFMNDPYIDPILLRQKILSAFNIEDYQDLITVPPPSPPDANTIYAQAEMAKAQSKMQELQIKSVEVSANLEKGKYDIEKLIAEIKEKETQSLKNIADAFAKERETILKTAEAINTNIEQRAIKRNENIEETSKQENSEKED
jgi:chaperonin GroES